MTVELHLGDCNIKKRLSETHKANIGAALRKGNRFTCLVCGNSFWRKPSAIKNGDCKFCSKGCYFIWQKGRERSQEFKDKCKNKSGEHNPNWRGGITPINLKIRYSKESTEWRKAVFVRDNYTCQKCGTRSSKDKYVRIEAHHIKPFSIYPELRFNIENGLTLCKACHSKEPKGKEIWSL